MTIQITTLDNGLRVITDNMPHVATATLGVWVEVGTRNEPADINGISHFLEHMAFKGTSRRSAKQIAEEIENVGGHLNAYTSKENTAYHARVLEADVPLAIDIIADILQNSIFEEQEISREREVILQEIGQTFDTPNDIIFDYFQLTAFPDHPLGRPTLGYADIIRNIGQDDLKQYIAKEYTASRMVFAATGAVDHKQVVDLCAKHFTKLATHSEKVFEKALYKGGHFYEARDLEQVHLLAGFESCPYDHEDFYALSVFSGLLGGGMSSRLFQEIREKHGLVYSIYSFNFSFKDTGLFGIYAGTGENQVFELIPLVKKILSDFPKDLMDQEIERSKAQLKAGILMSLESTSARCEQLAQHMMVYNRPLTSQEVIKNVDIVSREDLIRVSNNILSRPLTFAALGPGKEIRWD